MIFYPFDDCALLCQCSVFNLNSCCYRCVFPLPPPQSTIGSCENAGVVGPGTFYYHSFQLIIVPGLIGCQMAIEAIKILGGTGTSLAGKMLLYSGYDSKTS